MATVGSLVVRIGADVGGLAQGLETAQGRLRNFGSSLSSMGRGLTVGVTAPLVGIGVVALNSAMQFEESMNIMQSVSGATGAEMEALQAQALALGAQTSFSAGEAAAAQLELAKAGLNVNEVMAATPGVLDLAAAGDLEVAAAAEIAANAVNAFGLEAGATGKVADLLAATANKSSVEVTDLADSFNMVAAVASSYGFSIDEVSAALAIMGNNGLKGSDAGTALKTMFMRLAAPTAKAKGEIDALGIEVYDAQGNMNDFSTILASVETATAGMSEAQRNAAMNTIFGADATRAINILLKEGSGAYDAMAGSITQAGAAQEAADARMRGLGGAIEYFKGTLDSVLISTASPFLDTLNGMVRGAADMLGGITTLSPQVQKWGAIIGVAAAAAGPLLMVLGAMATGLAALLSPVGLVIGVVAGLGVAWATNFGGIQEKTAAAWAVVQPILQQLWTWVGATLPGALAALQGVFASAWGSISASVTTATGAIGPALETVRSAAETLWTGMSTFFAPAIDRVKAAFDTLRPQLEGMGPVMATLQTAVQTALTAAGEAFSGLWTAVQPILQAFGGAILLIIDFGINALASAIENMAAIATPIFSQLSTTITSIGTIVSETVALITAIVTGDWQGAWTSAQNIMATFGAYVLTTLQNLYDFGSAIFTTLRETVTGTLDDMGVDMGAIMDGIKAWWEEKWNSLVGFVEPVIDVVNGVVTALQDAWDWLQSHVFSNPFSGWDFNPFNNGDGAPTSGTPRADNAVPTRDNPGPRNDPILDLPSTQSVRLPASSAGWWQTEAVGAVAGGVSIGPVYINQDLDWEEIRWRLADLAKRRG